MPRSSVATGPSTSRTSGRRMASTTKACASITSASTKVTCFTSATTSFGSRTALISSLLIAAACGGERECIEHQRTIERGVYGEAVYITPEGEYTPLYNVL